MDPDSQHVFMFSMSCFLSSLGLLQGVRIQHPVIYPVCQDRDECEDSLPGLLPPEGQDEDGRAAPCFRRRPAGQNEVGFHKQIHWRA